MKKRLKFTGLAAMAIAPASIQASRGQRF